MPWYSIVMVIIATNINIISIVIIVSMLNHDCHAHYRNNRYQSLSHPEVVFIEMSSFSLFPLVLGWVLLGGVRISHLKTVNAFRLKGLPNLMLWVWCSSLAINYPIPQSGLLHNPPSRANSSLTNFPPFSARLLATNQLDPEKPNFPGCCHKIN